MYQLRAREGNGLFYLFIKVVFKKSLLFYKAILSSVEERMQTLESNRLGFNVQLSYFNKYLCPGKLGKLAGPNFIHELMNYLDSFIFQ